MKRWQQTAIGSLLALALAGVPSVRAETGSEAWLRYAPVEGVARTQYHTLPASVVVLSASPVLDNARQELIRGIHGMLGRTLRADASIRERCILLGTLADLRPTAPALRPVADLRGDAFWLTTARVNGFSCLAVTGSTDRGVLYGVFALLRRIARGESIAALNQVEQPHAPIRWIDQWDNLNGTIERGYAGPSIFFENGGVRADLSRAADYARLLASIGINGINVNNVNADLGVLEDNFLPQVARLADVFRPWGIRVSLSVDLSSPKVMGGLDTFDPLDPAVAAWWQKKVDAIYQRIPDFGGLTVKADSEGRLGPSTYGRTPADAANMIARALKPHGGVVFYRAFVYNHHLDWHDLKADRAKAAVENFGPLDGRFDDNVVIQIKHGPIDFQVREPASPLFSTLQKTNQAIELQITQEYLGQQHHLVYIPPMWKEVLDFDLQSGGGHTLVRDIVAGRTFHRPTGGFVGVANVGMDQNWLAHPLALANLYGFGRLAWNPALTAAAIAEEWTQLTFGGEPVVARTIPPMLLSSWHTYESYTGVLGLQTLTDILGTHYGPNVEAAERNGWGQWIRAEHDGIGMDRSVATGTGFSGQYPPAVARMYESAATTPEDLLLFFNHLPYTYRLRSGETVVQHVYDQHYAGTERAAQYVTQWQSLRGHIDEERYQQVLARLAYQAGHAIVWRDAVCTWFLRISGIADAKGRVGHYPDRVEAETMRLDGYTAIDITPPENASGGKAAECHAERCTAKVQFDRPAGWYELDVEYYDMPVGEAKFAVWVNQQRVDAWAANDHLPARRMGADSSSRRWIRGLALRPGDQIRIEGIPDGKDPAALDYVEVRARPR